MSVFGGELIRGVVPEETRPDEHHRGGSFSMCRRGFPGNATKGTGTTHGADQPLVLPCAIPRHVLSTILAANSTPKKMPIAAPQMTPIRIITPVTCVKVIPGPPWATQELATRANTGGRLSRLFAIGVGLFILSLPFIGYLLR
jgi:hypothetical protein